MHDLDRSTSTESESPFGYEYGAGEAEAGPVFNESYEMELAGELLSTSNEQELEQFLGDLVKSVGSAIGSFVKSPAGNMITGALKNVAAKALPAVGSAIGGYLGGPSGSQIGGQLAQQAGHIFGLELEGLSREDREYEIARQFVRFASDAVRNFLSAKPTQNQIANLRNAIIEAARTNAPGLLPLLQDAGAAATGAQSGRWVRKGNKIVVVGI